MSANLLVVREDEYDYNLPEGGAWLVDKYGVAYWSPNGEPGVWSAATIDNSGVPRFVFVTEREMERQQRLLDNATARGDLAAVAILSGSVRTYAMRTS